MKRCLWILLWLLGTAQFAPQPITPAPVLGFQSLPFDDAKQHVRREVLVWYPVAADTAGKPSDNPWDDFLVARDVPSLPGKRALIVVSHGYTGNPHQLSWLVRGLVDAGFVVAAVQHRDLIDGKAHINHWQRPQDVSALLDVFFASPLARIVDPSRVGATGFSLGGTTCVWLAGGRATKLDSLIPGREFAAGDDFTRADEALPTLNKDMMQRDWREPRIKAAFVMAPAWAWLFDEPNLRQVKIPMYFIAAANDRVLVTRNNAGFFARNVPAAIFRDIPGPADHYIFITALPDDKRKAADPSGELSFLFKDDTGIDRRWIQAQVVREAVNFFRAALPDISPKK